MKKIILLLTIGLCSACSSLKDAPIERTPPRAVNASERKILSFIGDSTHVEVYTFIKDALVNSSQSLPLLSKEKVEEWRKSEIRNAHVKDFKPHIAGMYEGELAGLLRILCCAQKECIYITLYQKNGVGIATSGFPDSIIFTPDRLIDFQVGILSPDVIKSSGMYTYMDDSGNLYEERLNAIYRHDNYAYLGGSKKDPRDTLIGYVSHIVRVS